LNQDRLNKVRELFDEASNLSAEERELYLTSKCADDPELKKEVQSLFNSFENTKDFLEEPLTIVEQNKSNFVDPYIGKQIGNYIIDGEAGIGGMGIVYTGKRNDKEFEQKVAIKILKHGITSEYLLKRFQIERQTLANLQHQNIARLLDGGRTSDGLPYLVMEFVDGIPITEYCNENKLDIAKRLNLFREVCTAVQYAHQNLVIHRDLKPGNILVTKDGIPKLLDFGIAKLIDEELVDNNEGLTRTGVWHLTPEYASPEQIKGEKITTASDIYSLGVLLYQILTGIQPYNITNNSPSAISKVITEERILKPSERIIQSSKIKANDQFINPDKISANLKGDLDNIVLKAMHKDPLKRYVSVEQFSEDIRRHLIGLPVIAQKDSASYRLSKFIQRHKVGFVSSVGFIVFLIASLIAIIWQAKVASNERDKAKLEAQKVETVNKFLQDMLSSVDPTEIGRDVKVYDVLRKSALDVEKGFKYQPGIEASIQKTIGRTLTNLGEYGEAKPHLLRSLLLNEKVYGKQSNQASESNYELALYYHWTGELKIADSLYKKSLQIFRSNKDVSIRSLASTLNDYGILKSDFAEFAESKKMYMEALNILLENYGEKDRDVASLYNNLAIVMQEQKDLDRAEKYFHKALDLNIELFGENRPEVSSNYNNLAYIYVDKEDFTKAEEYFIKSLELKKKYYGIDHSYIGFALLNLGGLEFRIGKINESEKYILDAIRNLIISVNDDHIWLGMSYYWYGKILIEKSKYLEAENYLLKSLLINKKNYPPDHPNIISSSAELGVVSFHLNRFAESEKLLVYGYNGVKKIKGETNHNTIRFLEYLVKLYEKTKNSDKLAYYNQLLLQAKK
jgi:serine/threonine-protein kinase